MLKLLDRSNCFFILVFLLALANLSGLAQTSAQQSQNNSGTSLADMVRGSEAQTITTGSKSEPPTTSTSSIVGEFYPSEARFSARGMTKRSPEQLLLAGIRGCARNESCRR